MSFFFVFFPYFKTKHNDCENQNWSFRCLKKMKIWYVKKKMRKKAKWKWNDFVINILWMIVKKSIRIFNVDIMKIISSTRFKIYFHNYNLFVHLCKHENDFSLNVFVEFCVKFTWFRTKQFTNLTNYLNRLRLTFNLTLWTSSKYDVQTNLCFFCCFRCHFCWSRERRMNAFIFFNQFKTIEQFIDR